MSSQPDWTDERLQPELRLVVGWRDRGAFRCMRIDLHQDVFADLEASCAPALAAVQSSEARAYEPFAALERGEQYFSFQLVDGEATSHAESSLQAQVQGADQLEVLEADELRRHRILFYAIVWPRENGGFL